MSSSSSTHPPEGSKALHQSWYDTHPPPDDNPSQITFLLGLMAPPSLFTARLNELFTKHCVSHRLWELPHPPKVMSEASLEAYYAATKAISQAVLKKYPGTPQRWVENWVRALVMASYDHPGAAFFPDGDSTDKQFASEKNQLPAPYSPAIPLHQMTFILTVYPTPTTTTSILEVVSSRCLRSPRFGSHPSEYQLSLFQDNFQSVLRDKNGDTDVDIRKGRLMWIRNDVLEIIENQHDFEIAFTQLYNERNGGWEIFFLFLPGESREDMREETGVIEDVVQELEVIKPLTYKPLDTTREKGKQKASGYGDMDGMQPKRLNPKGKGKEKTSDYGNIDDMRPEALNYKGKGKEKASESRDIEQVVYAGPSTLMHKEKWKGREKTSGYQEIERLPCIKPDILSAKGKGKENPSGSQELEQLLEIEPDISPAGWKGNEKASEFEQLQPKVYAQPDSEAEWFRGRTRTRENRNTNYHEELERLTDAQPGMSASKSEGKEKEEASDHAGTESSTVQTATAVAYQSPERSQAIQDVEKAVTDKMGTQIEYVITRTLDWGEGVEKAMKKAQQRVRETKKKEKDKQAEDEAQHVPGRAGGGAAAGNVSTLATTTRSSASQQSASASSSTQSESNQSSNIPRKTPPTQTRQSASSSTTSSSAPSKNTQKKPSNMSFMSTSSEALPYQMTDKERREKVMKIRSQFPQQERPGWDETEHALKTSGNMDKAVSNLGGPPKKSNIIPNRRRPLLGPSGSVSTTRLTRNSGMSGRSIGNTSQGESSSSRTPATQQGTESEKPTAPGIGLLTPATQEQEGIESKNPTTPGDVILTPPSTDHKDKSTRLSLQQRLQNAAHSAGKRISQKGSGTPKHETGKSDDVPTTPRSAGLRAVLGAFKPRGQASLVPPEAENKYYEFFVTRERAYRSGGDDEDAFNPLDGYLNLGGDMELNDDNEENEGGERSVKKPMDAMGLLKEIQNFKGLAQLTEPGGDESDLKRWLDCCRLFQVDPSETGMKERVDIAGIRQPLFQYQAFSVYWQMVNSRKFGGGFVADMPGLGKTLVFFSLIVVERQLCILWDEVHQSRRLKDGRHLPLTGQLADDVCPSQNDRPGWIACPCVFSHPTSQMPAQPGVRIAIVPDSLMSNWRAEWRKHIDPLRADLDMRLLLAHEGSVADRADTNQMADYHTNITALRANKVDKSPDTAKPNQEKFLVLATARSYDAWIERFKYGGTRSHILVPELNVLRTKYVWAKGFKYNIQFGIACVDESHEEYHIEKGRAGVLARLPGNPLCWGYSGTPLDKSPRCLEGVLWAIEKQAKKVDIESLTTGWAQNKELKVFRREVFDKICKEFESCNKSGTINEETLSSLKIQLLSFLSTFMIRRTPENRWFGHPLLTLNSNLHRDVFLMHDEKYDKEVKALTPEIKADAADRLQKLQAIWDKAPETKRSYERPRALGFNNNIHTQYKLRILATCPALIKLTTGENALTLKTDELAKWRGHNEKNSPYAKNLPEIFENSPKLMWLRECIVDLESQRDAEGAEQKMVIITNFNCIALIVKLMIEHYIPFKKGRVGLIHAKMKTSSRTAMLEAFTDARIDDKNGNAVRKRKENIQFLIGTTPMLSKGLQLTRACNVVLMEPDYEFYRELQGYARVNRIGQRNPWTFSYRLINDKSEVEKSILQRQKERGEFPGRVLKPGDVERMGPIDDGTTIDESGDLEQVVSWTAPKKRLTMLEPTLKKKTGISDLRRNRRNALVPEPDGQGTSV